LAVSEQSERHRLTPTSALGGTITGEIRFYTLGAYGTVDADHLRHCLWKTLPAQAQESQDTANLQSPPLTG